MRKILFHLPKLGSGGIEKLEEQWRPVAEKNGIQYVFTIIESGGELYEKLKKEGYRIYKVNTISEVGTVKFIKQFSRIIKSENIYGVHIPASPTSSLILLAAFFSGCKIRILHAHTNLYLQDNGKPWDIEHVRIFSLLNNLFANVRCTGSLSASKYCFGKSSRNIYFIKNGIDINKFRFDESRRNHFRDQLKINDCFVIGHVGRFTYQKNQEFLVDILREFKRINLPTKLFLLGEGEDETSLKDKIQAYGLQNDVLFLGTTEDLSPYYFAMDAFVFPSRYEGLGIAAVEAQCTGLKCILSDNVPDDAVVLKNTKKLSLSQSPIVWVNELVNFENIDRYNAYKEVAKAGYDENDTIQKMIDIYRR